MPSCVIRHCKNYYSKVNKVEGISYHVFPTSAVRLQEWIAIVRNQRSESKWMPSKSSTICSDHFKKNDKYLSGTGRVQLKKSAIPVIEKYKNSVIRNSPLRLDNPEHSDFEETSESSKNEALKQRIRKLIDEKQHLRKTNKTLVQHNKRLKKKITSTIVQINDIKKKDYIYLIV